ncbi:uncharacterized protein [Pseudorasbora parva]|uniref:uncharacterized protein n=1 Tax=Pseudorasbora parva TaxID=51549 RepID=UPI00351E522C
MRTGEREAGNTQRAGTRAEREAERICQNQTGETLRERMMVPKPGRKKTRAAAMQTPFADIIQALTGLHKEQHQSMLEIREEQVRRFQALFLAQQQDRELFRSCIDREVPAGDTSSTLASTTRMQLTKMGPQDDPEAFLDLFERSAEACGWPRLDWPVRLILLLSGEAQIAAQQLPVPNLLVYEDLRGAIRQRVRLSHEQHRQRFRSLTLGENSRPFVMAQQLLDTCRRWLRADQSTVN